MLQGTQLPQIMSSHGGTAVRAHPGSGSLSHGTEPAPNLQRAQMSPCQEQGLDLSAKGILHSQRSTGLQGMSKPGKYNTWQKFIPVTRDTPDVMNKFKFTSQLSS